MKTILVPTDFSANADNALDFATELAKRIKSKIILLNVFYINYTSGYVPYEILNDDIKNAKHESEQKLKALAKKVKAKGIECSIKTGHELLLDSVLRISAEVKADLIIMGTKGASNLPEGIIGTNTAAVIEKAECPVFAVPENCRFHEIKNIVLATDYRLGDFELIKKVADLFRPFHPHLALVHVSYADEMNGKDLMVNFAERARSEAGLSELSHTVLPPGNTESQLEAFVIERKIDLLVVSPRHHHLFSKLFGTSLTRKMAYHTHTPMLTLQN